MTDSLILRKDFKNIKAIEFCNEFLKSQRPKFIFGRNELAESIINAVNIDGVIDDFTDEKEFCNKPIIPINKVPRDALVVVVVIGKPLIAEKRVSQYQFQHIDYFSFYKYSGLPLKQVMFWDGMVEDIKSNFEKYQKIYKLLKDDVSKNQFYNIVNFRLSYDINYMRGFTAIEHLQYFEDFLNLTNNEVFVDVGGYDGLTTELFIKKYHNYKSIHIFEPEENNFSKLEDRLKSYKNIILHKIGLSNAKKKVFFHLSSNPSASKICEDGETVILVDKLDDVLNDKPTLIKMDIEGEEASAIEGASNIIYKYHPKLAISVYHKKDDFWKIPQQILSIRDDYDIYLRHYTEGIAETVMFFVPNNKQSS